jgi:hypothetical protein
MTAVKDLLKPPKCPNSLRCLTWHELSVLIIGAISTTSMILMIDASFTPYLAIFLAVPLLSITFQLFHLGFPNKRPTISFPLSAIVGVGLILRLEQWPNLAGGQDQGLYTNMSAALSRSGSINFIDPFRAKLPDDLQSIYDQAHLLSVNLVDSSLSLFTIEFYPLHPLWMAIGDSVSSPYGRHLSLLLFSLMGLAGAYQLSLEIDKRKEVAQLFVALLVVNPALVFFTKFPVTEVVAFAFAINGFLFLIRYLRATTSQSRHLNLLLTLLCFLSLGATRWQIILYAPFFLVLFIAALTPVFTQRLRTQILIIVSSIGFTLIPTLLYYKFAQPTLFAPMKATIVDALPSTQILFIGTVLTSFGLLTLRQPRLLKKLHKPSWQHQLSRLQSLAPVLLLLSFALSIFSILALYSSGVMPPWEYPVPLGDLYLFRFHSFYRLILFASPMAIVLLFMAPFISKSRSSILAAAYLFGALLWIVILTRPIVPYLYYYGRYLVVDMLPLVLLLASILCIDLGEQRSKFMMKLFYSSMLLYGLVFSALQIAHTEGEPRDTFEHFASLINDDDILILPVLDQRVVVPLRVTFERSVFVIENAMESPATLDRLRGIATEQGGRLILATFPQESPIGLTPFADLDLKDCYFTNTDHFRGGQHLGAQTSKLRFFLPSRWTCSSNPYQLFDLTDPFAAKSPLIENSGESGFFNQVKPDSIIVLSSLYQFGGSFSSLQKWANGAEILSQIPENTSPCFLNQLCTSDGRLIYILEIVGRQNGDILLLVTPSEGVGNPRYSLISMSSVRLFGRESAIPACAMDLPNPSGAIGSDTGWTSHSCTGSPALLATYLHWISFGCTSELDGWYICP